MLYSEVPFSSENYSVCDHSDIGPPVPCRAGAVIEISGHGNDAGAELTFDQVLLVGKDAGESWPARRCVGREGPRRGRQRTTSGAKVRIFKKKRRKQYRRTRAIAQTTCITRVDAIYSR